MYEKGGEITIRGKTYPLIFNTAAWEEVNSRYGSLEEMGKTLEDGRKALNEYIWILALLITQGVALKNFEEGTDEKGLTEDQVRLLMLPRDIISQQNPIIEVINAGMGANSAEAEDVVDEVLQEIEAGKNPEGAEE